MESYLRFSEWKAILWKTQINRLALFFLFATDIESERVEYVRMETGVDKNKHREPINLYYKTAIFTCGKPPDDGIPWRNDRYLL